MRTNIDLDDELIREAQRLSGLRTKKAVVDKALATFIRCAREREALEMFGKLQWEGDLATSREGRVGVGLAVAPEEAPAPHTRRGTPSRR
jgi:Arc/MetJ family transcription regulator